MQTKVKQKTFGALLALAVSGGLFATPVFADCPNGHVPANTGINVVSVTGGIGAFSIGGALPQGALDSGPKTDANCYTAGALSIGGAPAVTAGAVVDDQGDDDPTNDVSHYFPPVTAVLGRNSTAIGNKATVGKFETYTDPGADGVIGDDPATVADESADDTEQKRLVPVNSGTAVGANAHVGHNHSSAIGADAETTNDHQVAIGTGNDTIKARGIPSALSRARQDPTSIEVVTTDQFGNLASDGGALQGQVNDNTAKNVQQDDRLDNHSAALTNHNTRITANTAAIGSLEDVTADHENRLNAHDAILSQHSGQITKLNGRVDEAFEGVAMALAMESPQVDPGKRFGISLNVGTFEGENALAGAMRLRFDDTWSATGGVGYGLNSSTIGARAGIQAQW